MAQLKHKNRIHLKTYLLIIYIALAFSQTGVYSQQKPPVVREIIYSGNEYYSSSQLVDFSILKPGVVFSDAQFELDMKNLLKNYQQEGFIDIKIDKISREYNFDSSSISLAVNITEGKQTLLGELLFEGNKLFTTESLMRQVFTKSGKILDTRTLNQDISTILNMYEAKGYSFASVTVKNIETYNDNGKAKLRLTLRIDENEKIKIDRIVVEGNTETKEKVIVREIKLGAGNSVNKENLLEIKRNLENLGYFSAVDLPKILKYKNSTVLLIKVTEGSTNTFDGIIGYNPPAANEDKGYFTGLVNLSLRNLFGSGRRIDAKFQKEVKSTQELELKYFEPWVFNYPANISFGFNQRIEDTIYVKRTFGIKAEALITSRFTVSVLGDFARVIPTSTDAQNGIISIFDSRQLTTGIELKYDSRDYVYNPSRGILYRTGYTIGQKKIYNAAAFPGYNIPSNFTVQKFTGDAEFYYSFFRRQSTLLGLHGGEIKASRLDNADMFRFGGNATVRGYRDNQFLASRIIWSNIEFRYSITRKTFASAFYDIGYWRKPEDDINHTPLQKELIYGYGIGIRIETGLGIFGVSYALGKGDSFLEGKVHFGVINDF